MTTTPKIRQTGWAPSPEGGSSAAHALSATAARGVDTAAPVALLAAGHSASVLSAGASTATAAGGPAGGMPLPAGLHETAPVPLAGARNGGERLVGPPLSSAPNRGGRPRLTDAERETWRRYVMKSVLYDGAVVRTVRRPSDQSGDRQAARHQGVVLALLDERGLRKLPQVGA